MEEPCKCPPEGLPAWMGTFADLMSLLMCFFVLLLAFSEMDVLKFKQIAGSMKYAFGVQNLLEVKDIPKGTSVIAQEFRPGRPEPTPIETIMQQTIDMTQAKLEFHDGEEADAGGQQKAAGQQTGGRASATQAQSSQSQSETQAQQNETAKRIAQQLRDQIEDGAIEVESLGQQIIIRVREKGAFPSGSAFLQPKFRPVIRRVGEVIKDIPGIVTVSGHTDNQQAESELYRSNWDLSSQRAVSVAHELIKVRGFAEERLVVSGLADTQPLLKNNTLENRRRNRRVEIGIMQGKASQSGEIAVSGEE
ncbi:MULTISPECIES: flagellar motor protein MotB [Agarivorans]|uniref:Flagellar motor protein MotB n=1 Tax=Agarivorans aestuarii TaxID=1563703 RepID=A0ABU7G4L2_9ALTE|nr:MULTISPECIES: flagellar motor protein MotB [Agarivorans]MEE1674354.1 flagellar motor protein MotB [Agarivorans aestuarii]